MAGITGGTSTYLSVSKGFLVNKKKGIQFRGYVGYLAGLEKYEDEYNGKPMMKWKLRMKDDKSDEVVTIQFLDESWFSWGFFARIGKVDLKKPFHLGLSGSEENEKVTFCWMKQNGETVKKDESFPKPKKVKIGNQEVPDWTEVHKAIEGITAKLKTDFHTPAPTQEEKSDDLPF